MIKNIIRKFATLCTASVMALGICITAYAEPVDNTQTATIPQQQAQVTQQTQATATLEESISVKVQCSVPANFTNMLTVQYTGKTTEGFSVSLTAENNYTTTISVPRDIYLYKQSNVPNTYSLDTIDSFSLVKATTKNVYVLPMSVSVGQQASVDSNVKVKFKANLGDSGFTGSATVTYSGTDGNELTVTLNAENNYETELDIKKDIYTLKTTKVTDGFTADCLYSFSTKNVTTDKSELEINLSKVAEVTLQEMNSNETNANANSSNLTTLEQPTTQAVSVAGKTIGVKANIPSSLKKFSSIIYGEYVNANGEKIGFELSPDNSYSQMINVPIGSYALSYCVCFDTNEYTFSCQPNLTVDETTPDGIQLEVSILKDGKVLTDENSNRNSPLTTIIGFIALIVVALGCVFFFKKKGNAPKNSSKKSTKKSSKKDEDDEDFDYDEDEDDEEEDDDDEDDE